MPLNCNKIFATVQRYKVVVIAKYGYNVWDIRRHGISFVSAVNGKQENSVPAWKDSVTHFCISGTKVRLVMLLLSVRNEILFHRLNCALSSKMKCSSHLISPCDSKITR